MKTTSIFSTLLLSTLALAVPLNTRDCQAQNLQTFTGALGGIAATPVENSGNADRPFSVKGDTFVNLSAALQRSCDQQFNACANAANAGTGNFSVADCSAQQTACGAAN
ncbi:uncharacterized protein BDZ99DRAFT_308248 [Mytilinidion resinicola]|uniref:Uncharacterized protein n=1 Tax=Mytilinidion resinicola TaxID=574789 RepID=A0A6A6YNE2_9PEZI|nr:uncharacterized protein BDZ99DRAFT_308248 [Mytilinidion resinicola]KAF2810261.1 hypothetical protein BDZ99DRAFT_308248 [Mytilinidion resinicola]